MNKPTKTINIKNLAPNVIRILMPPNLKKGYLSLLIHRYKAQISIRKSSYIYIYKITKTIYLTQLKNDEVNTLRI